LEGGGGTIVILDVFLRKEAKEAKGRRKKKRTRGQMGAQNLLSP
jgi:hypothetical protein